VRTLLQVLVETCLKKKGVEYAGEEAEINARVAALYGL
jgi:hypothetical protein